MSSENPYIKKRADHKNELHEDYLKNIFYLINTKGEARVTDIADIMGITGASVNQGLNVLKEKGLVIAEKYRSIFLTDKGRELAEKIFDRYNYLRKLLILLGVDEANAAKDAEGIEHHISDETLKYIINFVEDK